METTVNLVEKPWDWFDLWRNALLHPTLKTYSRIGNDPRANTKWGLIWAAIAELVSWIVGPQRSLLVYPIANIFGGQQVYYYVSIFGAPVAVALGVLGLALVVSILHGFARLFQGEGTVRQLFFSWAVMQLPFLLLVGLVVYVPSIFSPSSREFTFSKVGLTLAYSKQFIMLCIYLYLFYAQVVAFSAVEKFSIGKGFGILILLGIILGIASSCLSYGIQGILIRFLRY